MRRLVEVLLFSASLALLLFAPLAHAGGPLAVTYTPVYPADAKPVTWTHMPIHYRVDAGPLSSRYTNAQGIQRAQSAFNVWHNVSTAKLSFVNDGALAADVNSATAFNKAVGDCNKGAYSPIMFDANGAIMTALGYPSEVIAFAGICEVDANGSVVTGMALLDGEWQDGITSQASPEITPAEFDEAFTHELGHFLGLDHSQINSQVLYSYPCDKDALAGLPLMFPYLGCQARSTVGLPMLAPDDMAWISALYPAANFSTSYAVISGYILFGDGLSQMQGANVIARRVDNPLTPENESLRVAVSAVSGYLFTSNPGQSLTANYLHCNTSAEACPASGFFDDNTAGGTSGSRSPAVVGYYQVAVPPGTYTIEIEPVLYFFRGGSSVGPLDPPVGNFIFEYWNDNDAAVENSYAKDTITVSGGEKKENINIILNTFESRFDQLEGPGARLRPPLQQVTTEEEVTL